MRSYYSTLHERRLLDYIAVLSSYDLCNEHVLETTFGGS
jgi:hypothetical protein